MGSSLVMGARPSMVTAGPAGAALSAAGSSGLVAGGGLRGKIVGWSRQSSGRHLRWLQSVDSAALDGLHGYAITLTVRDCPGDADGWLHVRGAYFRFLRALPGVVAVHWVTELTRRRVPHLHLALYALEPLTGRQRYELLAEWTRVADEFGAKLQGQHMDRIRPGVGWDRYCAKHSSRSVSHYQREGLPPGWDRTGRLWGQWGIWTVRERRYLLDGEAAVQMRRLMRAWAVSSAKREALRLAGRRGGPVDWRGVMAARRMLQTDPALWAVRGFRCWVPERVTERMLQAVASMPGCCVVELVAGDELYGRENVGTRRVGRALGVDVRELPHVAVRPLELDL